MNLRPRLIDAYIIKKFLMTFFVMIFLIMGIVIIFDISEKIDDFISNHAPLKAIVIDYYCNFIPYFMNMFSPLFVFIAVIFFTSRMAVNTEIIGILSCGISFHRMMLPYMFSAAIIAGLSLCLNLFVIPKANYHRHLFEEKYRNKDKSFETTNMHYQIAPGEFVYVESFSKWNNTAYRLTLEKIKNNELVSKLTAESAVWDSTFQGWRLRRYFIRTYKEGSLEEKIRSGNVLDTVINLNIKDFYRRSDSFEELSNKELNDMIATQKMRGDANIKYALIEKNVRWSLPFSAFILTIIGVSLSSRKRRGGIGWNMAAGIALSFSYILFMRFSQMFVLKGNMSPYIAVWIPNILFAVIALILYLKAIK